MGETFFDVRQPPGLQISISRRNPAQFVFAKVIGEGDFPGPPARAGVLRTGEGLGEGRQYTKEVRKSNNYLLTGDFFLSILCIV